MYLTNYLTLVLFKLFYCTTCHTSSQVCYGKLGCFSNSYPFYDSVLRPIDALPDSPEKINANFLLYSYINQELPRELNPKKFETIKYSTLSKRYKVKIIIPGFVQDFHQTNQWIKDLIKKHVKSQPLNVIVVDWSDGAVDYPRSVANSRVVGAQIAQLITDLKTLVSTSLSTIELIGEGVGAHVAAYAGQRLKGKLGRITGISPARLYFEGLPNEVKLDESDAQVVKIIDDRSAHETSPDDKQSQFIPRLG